VLYSTLTRGETAFSISILNWSVLRRLSEISSELPIFCFLLRYRRKVNNPTIVHPTASTNAPTTMVLVDDLAVFEQREPPGHCEFPRLADWGICCDLRPVKPGPKGSGLLGSLSRSLDGHSLRVSNSAPHRPLLFANWKPPFSLFNPIMQKELKLVSSTLLCNSSTICFFYSQNLVTCTIFDAQHLYRLFFIPQNILLKPQRKHSSEIFRLVNQNICSLAKLTRKKVEWLECSSPEGTSPERELLRKSSTVRRGTCTSLEGIEPKRWLKLKSNLIKLGRSPSEAGIAPVSWLDCRVRTESFFNRPS
jgi:hypothetical protein